MQVKQLSPNTLPITRHLPKIVELIQSNPVVVISGKTGCGKSTQVPKTIWKHNPKAKIAVCQPRRVAVTSLAIRVASEVGCRIGSNVGYHIGMQTFKSQNCSIIYMTYGILIQQLLFQHQLPYTHIVLDQIHQRSLQMDFSFVALKNLLNQRRLDNKSTSKLIIMSATLDSQQFAKYFASNIQTGQFFIPNIKVKQNQQNQNRQTTQRGTRNRQFQSEHFQRTEMDQRYVQAAMYDIPEEKNFKVQEIFWRGDSLYRQSIEQEPRISDQTIEQALRLMQKIKNQNKIQGDILFFLPGYYQIQIVKRRLLQINVNEERIVQVHSIFSQQLYQKLFLSKVQNKLILATNIGESSITLPFCTVVIDFCLTKKNTIRQQGINQLQTRFASKASLTQRAGRVGRVADGYVFRMITKQLYQSLPQYQQPQIKCISLQMVILRAKQLDYINNSKVFADPYRFLQGVMNPPKIEAIKSAIQHLIHQQALLGPGSKIQQASQLQLTKIGQFMVSMPCDMQISKMILMSIKLRIPGLVVAIASIMIATKMFFVHQDRRENIEQFMHSLIGYDSGLSNDYFLRQRIYNHWKEKFYYPIKQRKMYKKKVSNNQNKQTNEKEFSRKYEQDQQQAQDTAVFLQQFCQQRWTQIQKDFCFPRGLNLMTLRQIIKIEQNLRLRLKKLGVSLESNEKRNQNLFLLCLTYAFPDFSCQINYSKYIKSCKKELNYVQFPASWEITNKMIDNYIVPERQYQIERDQKFVRIYGAPKVLKKFIFPQFFSKNSLTKYVSQLFENLVQAKISNKFQCDVGHKFYQVVVLNESVNRVIIVTDYQKVYRLLTHQISMNNNNRKLVKISAIIDEQTYALIQLITNKEVQVSLHPSQQFLKSFTVNGVKYNFKRIVSEEELNIIRNLRNVAIRKNTNIIHSSEQVMSQNDIQTLLHFLQSNDMKTRQPDPWQCIFLSRNYSQQNQGYYPLSYPFQFTKKKYFLKEYQEWKKKQYHEYLKLYWPITLHEYYIICADCEHIEPIEHATFYDPQKKVLRMNQYSGSWVQKNNHLYCEQGHPIGDILQDGQTSSLNFDKLQIYEPCNKRFQFWKQWPSREELIAMNQRSKALVEQFKQQIDKFQCPFCFEKDSENTLMKFNSRYEKNFWKKVQQHLYSSSHLNWLALFKKSLRKQPQF